MYIQSQTCRLVCRPTQYIMYVYTHNIIFYYNMLFLNITTYMHTIL